MRKPAVHVHGLTVHYGTTPVLWDVGFEVPSGKLVAILGPNGAGKSTLIKAVLGLVPKRSGVVHLHKARGKVAYFPQREAIDWDFPITVRELVLMGRYPKIGLFRWLRKADREAADAALERVGLGAVAHRQISQLSGGQQQRAFLARALLQEADVYFLDEPLASVDHASERVIMELLMEMRDAGKSIFVVHHDLNTVEQYFDWVVLLNVRLVACGAVKDVFVQPRLLEAYGRGLMLYDEALRLSSQKAAGL